MVKSVSSPNWKTLNRGLPPAFLGPPFFTFTVTSPSPRPSGLRPFRSAAPIQEVVEGKSDVIREDHLRAPARTRCVRNSEDASRTEPVFEGHRNGARRAEGGIEPGRSWQSQEASYARLDVLAGEEEWHKEWEG